MAHFAKLDFTNTVVQVLVVSNDELLDSQGIENESLGVTFLQSLFGNDTTWKQTSYNQNFRKNYAGIGYTYSYEKDAFIPPMPDDEESWTLNEETLQWEQVSNTSVP
jgi:hypothetical protein